MRTMAATVGALWGAAVICSCATPAGSRKADRTGMDTVTEASASQTAQDEAARLAKFREEIQRSKDPVALAAQMAKDKSFRCAVAGMDELLIRWEDQRSEQVLSELAKGEPKYLGDGLLTCHGEAYERLLQVQAKMTHRELTGGKRTERERLDAVRAYFKEHAEWLDVRKRPTSKRFLVQELIREAMVSGKAEAIDLVVASGFRDIGDYSDYVTKHSVDLIEYARKLGHERTLSSPNLLHVLVYTRRNELVPLLMDWLGQTKDGEDIRSLISALVKLPNTKERLLGLLEDPRPEVVRQTAAWIDHSFPDKTSLAALAKAYERRKSAGATNKELDFLLAITKAIEEKVAKQERGERE